MKFNKLFFELYQNAEVAIRYCNEIIFKSRCKCRYFSLSPAMSSFLSFSFFILFVYASQSIFNTHLVPLFTIFLASWQWIHILHRTNRSTKSDKNDLKLWKMRSLTMTFTSGLFSFVSWKSDKPGFFSFKNKNSFFLVFGQSHRIGYIKLEQTFYDSRNMWRNKAQWFFCFIEITCLSIV